MIYWRRVLIVFSICSVLFLLLFLLGSYYSSSYTDTQGISLSNQQQHSIADSDDLSSHFTREIKREISDSGTQALYPLPFESTVEYKTPQILVLAPTTSKTASMQSSEFLESTLEHQDTFSGRKKKYTLKNDADTYVLFFVLDDAGASLKQIAPYLSFAGTVTLAVLPFLSYTAQIVDALQKNNVPYMLHMPMQPIGNESPGEYALKVSYSENQISELIHNSLQSVAGSIGFNNHMGSLATADKRLMHTVLKTAKQKNLIFLDSRTSSNTVAEEVADSLGMHIIVRDVFIDNNNNVQYITEQIKKGMTLAKQKGFAVLIGHVTKPNTFIAISTMYPTIVEDGGQLVGLNSFFEYVQVSSPPR